MQTNTLHRCYVPPLIMNKKTRNASNIIPVTPLPHIQKTIIRLYYSRCNQPSNPSRTDARWRSAAARMVQLSQTFVGRGTIVTGPGTVRKSMQRHPVITGQAASWAYWRNRTRKSLIRTRTSTPWLIGIRWNRRGHWTEELCRGIGCWNHSSHYVIIVVFIFSITSFITILQKSNTPFLPPAQQTSGNYHL